MTEQFLNVAEVTVPLIIAEPPPNLIWQVSRVILVAPPPRLIEAQSPFCGLPPDVSLFEVNIVCRAWIAPLTYKYAPDRNLTTTPESTVNVCGLFTVTLPLTMYGLPARVHVLSLVILPETFVRALDIVNSNPTSNKTVTVLITFLLWEIDTYAVL